jgi:hypothetical protein
VAIRSITRESLVGAWTHAHEEDVGDKLVYRPSAGEFPPARGRDSLELRSDGTLARRSPGADDRSVVKVGTWDLVGHRIGLYQPGTPLVSFDVDEVSDDRLVVRRA